MAEKLTRLTHKIAIQLQLVAESCAICSSHSRWPIRKLLDTPLYVIQCRTVANLSTWHSIITLTNIIISTHLQILSSHPLQQMSQ